jgi:uncharacterized damage-inducible protein DinB
MVKATYLGGAEMPTDSVQDAWNANLEVNLVLLEHLTPEMLEARTPGGGFSVAQHLAHLVGTTKYWGSRFDVRLKALPRLFTVREELPEDDLEAFVPETDLTRIREVLTVTARAAQGASREAPTGDAGEPPHASADAFLLHMMVHDAHHRGQILLALKTAGYTLPDEDALWGPWRGG